MWLLEILFPPCISFDVALQIPRYYWQRDPPPRMEFRKRDAAIY